MTGQSALRTGVELPIDKNNLRSLPLESLESLEFVRSNIQDGGSDNGPYRRN